MQLSRALNDYLDELDMKQADVRRASGMSDAHVSQVFSGKIKDPNASVVYKIARAMGISVDALLSRANSYGEESATGSQFRFKEVRLRHGKKQAEVAHALGIGISAYSMMENGQREINSSKLVKLSRFYGCSVDELLGTGAWGNPDAHDRRGGARGANQTEGSSGGRWL